MNSQVWRRVYFCQSRAKFGARFVPKFLPTDSTLGFFFSMNFHVVLAVGGGEKGKIYHI